MKEIHKIISLINKSGKVMNNLVDIWKMNGKWMRIKWMRKNIYLYKCKSMKLIKNGIKWKWINRCERYENKTTINTVYSYDQTNSIFVPGLTVVK